MQASSERRATRAGRAERGRGAHARVLQQRGFDLAQLDAHAAELDLLIGASEELEHPVGPHPAQIPGAIDATGMPGNGFGTKRSAVSAGWCR